jgi:hypothetical protein
MEAGVLMKHHLMQHSCKTPAFSIVIYISKPFTQPGTPRDEIPWSYFELYRYVESTEEGRGPGKIGDRAVVIK